MERMTWAGTFRGSHQPGRIQQLGQNKGGQGQLVLTGLLLQLLQALQYMAACGGGPEDLEGRQGSTTHLPGGCQDVRKCPKQPSLLLLKQGGRSLAPSFPPYVRSFRCRRCRGSCRDSLFSCRTPGASSPPRTLVAPAGGRRDRLFSNVHEQHNLEVNIFTF